MNGYTIAEGCILTHRFDDCAKYAQAAVSRIPNDESMNLLLIRSLVYLKRLDQAANALETAKTRVPPTSNVRSLHSIIYASAAAAKAWDESLPHIEKHVDYLAEAVVTHPEDAVQIHFWIDQLALAYRNTDSDDPDRLLRWRERFDALSIDPRPPWKNAPLRAQCAALELRCAAEFHVGHGLLGARFAEWADVIRDSYLLRSESEIATETSFLCNFLRSHGHEFHSKTRATVIAKLDEIERTVFQIYPTRHGAQVLSAVANARKSLLIARKPQ